VLTRHYEHQRILRKEQRICEPDSFLSQAARWYVCELPPYALCQLDRTTHFLPAPWHTRRFWQKQIRAHGRKCALTTTTHHPQAAGETASLHEEGSPSPRALSTGCSGLEANALDRSTRNPAAARIGSSSVCTGSAGLRSVRLPRGYLQRPSL